MLNQLQGKVLRRVLLIDSIDIVIPFVIVGIGVWGWLTSQSPAAIISLMSSIGVAYLTTFRLFLRKPQLKWVIDEVRCSPPTQQGDTASWFIRLGIVNCGLTPAKGCIARIIGVWSKRGEQLKKFDPLTLFWSRQDNKHTNFNPVDIQGYGDVEYLDIAQVKRNDATPLSLRVVLPPPMTLSRGDDTSLSPGTAPALRAGTYYIQIAIYSADAYIRPVWFELTCSENIPSCGDHAPCRITKKKPPHVR